MLSEAVCESSIPVIQPVDHRTRAEIISRYRHFRAISVAHNSGASRCFSWDGFREQARRLGIARGKTFILNTEDELTYVNDLMIYAHQGGRKRAIDRYAASKLPSAESDEVLVLQAMLAARFAILRVERLHPVAGLIMYDVVRDEEFWLLDEGMEKTVPSGVMIATRVYQPEDFFMAAGVFVPLDTDLLRGALMSRPHLMRMERDDTIQDRRFAEAIYRQAIESGATERIRFEDPDNWAGVLG